MSIFLSYASPNVIVCIGWLVGRSVGLPYFFRLILYVKSLVYSQVLSKVRWISFTMVEFIYFFSMKIGFGEVKNIVFAYVLKYVYLLLKSVIYFSSVSEIFIGGPEYLGYIQ